jgi:putative ABC transport system ATP-binding protein
MIKLSNVEKTYGNAKNPDSQTHALKGITLTIEDGEMVAVMGPSGSGKSTLLNILGCMDSLTAGQYLVDDVEVSALKPAKRRTFAKENISFVFQDFALMKDYTIFENVELPLKIKNVPRKERKKIVLECLEEVGISDIRKKFPLKTSGGQQQRCAIARALASGNNLILADEPTGALDRENGQNIMNILRKVNQKGKTVVVITHDPEVAKHCDRIIRIVDGQIEA